MNKPGIISAIVLLTVVLRISIADCQEQSLCYKTSTKIIHHLPYDATLTTPELLDTRIVSFNKDHQEYLNGEGYYIHDYRYIHQRNLYPTWHMVPDLIRNDESGISYFFYSTTSLLEGGWYGYEYDAKSQTGKYDGGIGEGNPRRYYSEYDSEQISIYEQANDLIVSNSILITKEYIIPSKQVLDQYIMLGYNVINTQSKIKVKTPYFIKEWDLDNQIIKTIYLSTTGEESIQLELYKYNDEVGKNLLNQETITEPYYTEAGDCAKQVTTIKYLEYQLGCAELRPREKSTRANNDVLLTISPNPSIDQINIDLPIEEGWKYRIFNLYGSVVASGKLTSNSIDVRTLAPGTYSLSLQNNNEVITQQFVKQ